MAFSIPSAAHHLPWAKGRSTETVKTTVSSMSERAWLKWRVWVEQIPVSMDGITLRTFFLPAKSAKDFFSKLGVVSEKSWAVSPTWSWDPVKVTGFPKNVVIAKTPFFFSLYINEGGRATDLFENLISLESYLFKPSAIFSKFHFIML